MIDVNHCTYSGNIGIVSGGYMQKDDPERSFDFGVFHSLAGSTLTMIGFAECEPHAPVSLMNEVVDTMTDRKSRGCLIGRLLRRNAIEKLIERGFGARLPMRSAKSNRFPAASICQTGLLGPSLALDASIPPIF